jgi:hypothetical protein
MKPQSQSAERLKPWEALGTSRATYKRKARAAATGKAGATETPAASGQDGVSPAISGARLASLDTESVRATNQSHVLNSSNWEAELLAWLRATSLKRQSLRRVLEAA